MSSSNCCFLTCIQISQEAGQVVWYSHLFQNFPQFVVVHTVKGFVLSKNRSRCFFGTLLLFRWSSGCWQFGLWFLCLLYCFNSFKFHWLYINKVSASNHFSFILWFPTALMKQLTQYQGCHFLLQCMKVKNESEVTQSCPTLSDPRDCSLPGSFSHGIFQARVLEWGAIAFSDSKLYLGIRVIPLKSGRSSLITIITRVSCSTQLS